jgi:hypothetical protein
MTRLSAEGLIDPIWPAGEFDLIALDGGWGMGPFTGPGFARADDGGLWDAPQGAHPVHLLVRGQVGDLILANEGDVRPMVYKVVSAAADEPQNDARVLLYDSDEKDDDGRASERRSFFASLLLSRLEVPSIEDYYGQTPYEPSTIAIAARRLIRGLERASVTEAGVKLAHAVAQLLYLAKMAWWPWFVEGHFSNPDEYIGELVEVYLGEDHWLGVPLRGKRRLYAELREALDDLVEKAGQLEARGAERVTTKRVEAVAYGATEWAINSLMLAVEQDLTIVAQPFVGASPLGQAR